MDKNEWTNIYGIKYAFGWGMFMVGICLDKTMIYFRFLFIQFNYNFVKNSFFIRIKHPIII